jgi:ATP-binding cassette subfamily F protein 3
VNNVFKSFADQLILKDISFVVNAGERVGLIGPNGSGKTTLLRLIADEEQPDRGSVFIDPHTRLGYLRQGLEYPIGCTLADVLHDPRVDTIAEIEHLAMASAFDPARLPQYQAALDRLEAQGGYPDQSARDNVLQNLGLDRVPLSLAVAALSGGQKTRLGLAKVLLSAPNLLLLDEPTNHLDSPMLTWLEEWLARFRARCCWCRTTAYFLIDRSIACCISIRRHAHCAVTVAITRLIWSKDSRRDRQRKRISNKKLKSGG